LELQFEFPLSAQSNSNSILTKPAWKNVGAWKEGEAMVRKSFKASLGGRRPRARRERRGIFQHHQSRLSRHVTKLIMNVNRRGMNLVFFHSNCSHFSTKKFLWDKSLAPQKLSWKPMN